jgi:hypothetical protein
MLQLLLQVKNVQMSVRPTTDESTYHILPQIFVLFGTGAVPSPPHPTQWGEGGLIGPPRDIRYFLIYNLHKAYVTGGSNQTSFFGLLVFCPAVGKRDNASPNPTPCFLPSHVHLLGEPASLLVVTNAHPPLSLICQQLPPPFACPPTLSHPTFQITLFT